MEKKRDIVIPADLKRLFVSGRHISPAGHERVKLHLSYNWGTGTFCSSCICASYKNHVCNRLYTVTA